MICNCEKGVKVGMGRVGKGWVWTAVFTFLLIFLKISKKFLKLKIFIKESIFATNFYVF